jgi:hypothetical protein
MSTYVAWCVMCLIFGWSASNVPLEAGTWPVVNLNSLYCYAGDIVVSIQFLRILGPHRVQQFPFKLYVLLALRSCHI